jgi:hypothetical protein
MRALFRPRRVSDLFKWSVTCSSGLTRARSVPVQATYTLAQAPEALAARAATHSQGKIAIQIG